MFTPWSGHRRKKGLGEPIWMSRVRFRRAVLSKDSQRGDLREGEGQHSPAKGPQPRHASPRSPTATCGYASVDQNSLGIPLFRLGLDAERSALEANVSRKSFCRNLFARLSYADFCWSKIMQIFVCLSYADSPPYPKWRSRKLPVVLPPAVSVNPDDTQVAKHDQ